VPIAGIGKKAASQRLGNPTRIRVTIEAIES
jgi:hypothetical protein